MNLHVIDPIEITQNDTTVYGDSISLSVGNIHNNLPINLQSGLVAYYPFNNNANDESENEHHGIVNGVSTANDLEIVIKHTILMEIQQLILKTIQINLSTTEQLSISVWAKSTSNQYVSHILENVPTQLSIK